MSRIVTSPDGTRLRARAWGDPRAPALVLLHGLTASADALVLLPESLTRSGLRVIAYDARGHGASSAAPSRSGYGYDALARDLESVLDAFGVRRALLAGTSMGSHTAVRVALTRPERVAGLAVITPAYDPAHDVRDVAGAWDRMAATLDREGIDAFVADHALVRGAGPLASAMASLLRSRMARHADLGAVADAIRGVARSRPFASLSDLATLAALDQPTLVVGSRDTWDPLHPLGLARRYAEAVPGATLLCEPEGRRPLAWSGPRLTRAVAEALAVAAPTR